jgi:hypothetical protein
MGEPHGYRHRGSQLYKSPNPVDDLLVDTDYRQIDAANDGRLWTIHGTAAGMYQAENSIAVSINDTIRGASVALVFTAWVAAVYAGSFGVI